MTDNLVERLRADDFLSNRGPNYEPLRIPASALRLEAASEITRLQEALAAAEAERDAIEVKLATLRRGGAGLANIAFNIHQLGAANPSDIQSLKSAQLEWDAAIRALAEEVRT